MLERIFLKKLYLKIVKLESYMKQQISKWRTMFINTSLSKSIYIYDHIDSLDWEQISTWETFNSGQKLDLFVLSSILTLAKLNYFMPQDLGTKTWKVALLIITSFKGALIKNFRHTWLWFLAVKGVGFSSESV